MTYVRSALQAILRDHGGVLPFDSIYIPSPCAATGADPIARTVTAARVADHNAAVAAPRPLFRARDHPDFHRVESEVERELEKMRLLLDATPPDRQSPIEKRENGSFGRVVRPPIDRLSA